MRSIQSTLCRSSEYRSSPVQCQNNTITFALIQAFPHQPGPISYTLVALHNSFVDTALYRFRRNGLKLPIHATLLGVFGVYFPSMTSFIVLDPKSTDVNTTVQITSVRFQRNFAQGSRMPCRQRLRDKNCKF